MDQYYKPVDDPWASTINPWATHGPLRYYEAMGDPYVNTV